MNAWSNVEVPADDIEIYKINEIEKKLGKLPDKVNQIRNLITRFEVCHFKYQQHLKKIKNSIINLQLDIDPVRIGINHIKNGENAWKNDKTGRSIIGQQYVWGIKEWLGEYPEGKSASHYNKKLGQQIKKWLGDKNPDKERLVRLLLARLVWDWEPYEELQRGGKYKDLEFQACRMDICHYAFPENLDLLLEGIGKMKAVEKFEGCGSSDSNIKTFVEKEFSGLNGSLKSLISAGKPDKNESIKAWLVACLAKTLKEQVNLTEPIIL
jgi:hypothetical protein